MNAPSSTAHAQYAFPLLDEGNPTHIRVDLNDVQQELKTLLEHKRVSTYKMTTCEKQYAFTGTDIPRKATYIKLQYSYKGMWQL